MVHNSEKIENTHSHFIVPIKYYVMTLLVLLIMTVVTVYTAKYVNLGWGNIIIAMFIATIKASFVLLFFMGLRWDKGALNIAVFLSALVVFVIFVVFVLLDTATRGSIDIEEATKQNLKTPVKID